MQLGVLGDPRLDEERGLPRVDAGGEPVDHHVPDVLLDDFRLLVVRRERMPVGDEEIARILALQPHPVLERAVIVAEVQTARRAHSRHHPFGEHPQSILNAFAISCIEPATIGPRTIPSTFVNISARRIGKPQGSRRAY